MNITSILVSLIAIFISAFKIEDDVIPNVKTAFEIGEKDLFAKFGENIDNSKPNRAILEKDTIWHLFGTLKPVERSINENGETTIRLHLGVPTYFFY